MALLGDLNTVGQEFVRFSYAMLIQSSILILVLLALDLVLRKRVRAVFRYYLWMLVLVKLILPTTLTFPTGVGYWVGEKFTAGPVAMPMAFQPEEKSFVGQGPHYAEIKVSKPIRPIPVPPFQTASVPATASTPITWQAVLFLCWILVVVVMALLMIQRYFFVKGLIAQAEPAADDLIGTLQNCRRKMGMAQVPEIKVSPAMVSPAACGLIRPVILMPEFLPAKLTEQEMHGVLIHELAHIRRGDLWMNLLQTLLQVLYFYNPLLWLANAVIRRIREQAVDETVLAEISVLGKEENADIGNMYAQTLVNVARVATLRPALSLRMVGVVESKSALPGRIKHILNRRIPKTAKLGFLGLAGIVIFAAVLLPMAKGETKPKFIISGIVKDAITGKPIVGAKVSDEGYGPKPYKYGFTDSFGKFQYTTWNEEHSIKAEAPGYGSQQLTLFTDFLQMKKGKVLDFSLIPADAAQSGLIHTLPNRYLPPHTTLVSIPSDWDKKRLQSALINFLKDQTRILLPESTFEANDGQIKISYHTQEFVIVENANMSGTVKEQRRVIGPEPDGLMVSVWMNDQKGQVGRPQTITQGSWKVYLAEVYIPNLKTYVQANVSYGPKTDISILNKFMNLQQWFSQPPFQDSSDIKHSPQNQVSSTTSPVQPNSPDKSPEIRIYPVNRKVSEFPETEDFSTPESAYAAINRVMGQGKMAGWRRVSSRQNLPRIGRGKDEPYDEKWDKVCQNARIIEVRVWKNHAQILAEFPKDFKVIKYPIDSRYVLWEEGGWRNMGEDQFATVEKAETQFYRMIEYYQKEEKELARYDSQIRKYPVNRNVSSFAEGDDFSRPETAYASINRIMASGNLNRLIQASVRELANPLKTERSCIPPEWNKVILNEEILEVRIWKNEAVVLARLLQKFSFQPIRKPIDVRHLRLENGRWLNAGGTRVDSIEEADLFFKKTIHRLNNQENRNGSSSNLPKPKIEGKNKISYQSPNPSATMNKLPSFVITGKVIDEGGKPMEGVGIDVETGRGSLIPTGKAVTGPDGTYTVRFSGSRIDWDKKTGKWTFPFQAAIIMPLKEGYYEKNLHRQGNLYISEEPFEKNNSWHATLEHTILPNKPLNVDFILLPAARIEGQVIDESGKPVTDYNLWLKGKELPPGASVFDNIYPNKEGKFTINNMPLKPYAFWFSIGRKDGREITGTEPLRFDRPGGYKVSLTFSAEKSTLTCKAIPANQKTFSGNPSSEKDKSPAAVKAAESWLRLVDEGKYLASYDQAASFFRKALAGADWETALNAVRPALGKVLSRKILSKTYATALPGAPDGEYVVIQFTTSFENKKEAIETITPTKEKDGTWKVSGYYIK
jgi:beta-lactamase regulating signal transducer with metallopeptidase domain